MVSFFAFILHILEANGRKRGEIIKREQIFEAIVRERERQEEIHPIIKKKPIDNADYKAVENMIMSYEFLAVLTEEFGEVGSALQGEGDLKEELIQVASVCVRWLEHMK